MTDTTTPNHEARVLDRILSDAERAIDPLDAFRADPTDENLDALVHCYGGEHLILNHWGLVPVQRLLASMARVKWRDENPVVRERAMHSTPRDHARQLVRALLRNAREWTAKLQQVTDYFDSAMIGGDALAVSDQYAHTPTIRDCDDSIGTLLARARIVVEAGNRMAAQDELRRGMR